MAHGSYITPCASALCTCARSSLYPPALTTTMHYIWTQSAQVQEHVSVYKVCGCMPAATSPRHSDSDVSSGLCQWHSARRRRRRHRHRQPPSPPSSGLRRHSQRLSCQQDARCLSANRHSESNRSRRRPMSTAPSVFGKLIRDLSSGPHL